MSGAYQVLSDCPRCRVESALLELMEHRISVALTGRCRLCGYATDLGDVVSEGQTFQGASEVIEALARWAREDGESDLEVFAVANFNGAPPARIAALVLAGERVPTGFDVIAYLFPGMAGGGGGAARREERGEVAMAPKPAGAAPAEERRVEPRQADPRSVGRALVSMMIADGQVRKGERRFLDETLRRMGAAALDDADLRVWRPRELGEVPDRKAVLEAMRLLALVDHEADGTELRVLKEYARAWQLPLSEEALERPNAMAQLGRALMGLFVK